MFEQVKPAAPDPILGLTEAFSRDPSPNKINLGVGVYKAADGRTPVLDCVVEAERRMLDRQSTKTYKPIPGDPAYGLLVQEMIFGSGSSVIRDGRAVTLHTPGGTGGLRIAGDYLHTMCPKATIWLSQPTWANHAAIFEAAGVSTQSYPYFDANINALDFDRMMAGFDQVPAGDVVLLHAACHNPTGVDPTPEQWGRIGELFAKRGILPLIDFAYQGFGDGLEEDAAGVRAIAEKTPEMLVCSSFSKNFALYNERVGALTAVTRDHSAAEAVLSHLKVNVRRSYSNPPAHGADIVITILQDEALRSQWQTELAGMRDRINGMRTLFAATLDNKGVSLSPEGNGFIAAQRGMFSMSGLKREHVDALREKHSIYIVGSGRINVAGMTEDNIPKLCDAIADVL